MKSMNQCGRSMVEMLGVLAIIGVLSAAGLKGYSDAMFKHKMNKTIDIATHMFQRVDELYQKGIAEASIQQNKAVQYGLLEKCDLENGRCRLPMGSVEMDIMEGAGAFWFHFSDTKSCIAFASVHWEQMVPEEWWNPNGYITTFHEDSVDDWLYYPTGSKTTFPSTSEYVTACQNACTTGDCGIYLQIYDY